MANIFDYIAWRGDLSFRKSPFNPVDNIILTHAAYFPFDGIVPGPEEKGCITVAEAAKQAAAILERDSKAFGDRLIFKDDPALLAALGASERYGGLKLAGFVNQIDLNAEKQFSALTILSCDKAALVSYRGTDNTIIGWKEDFNMSFSTPIPAQLEAVAYLERTAARFRSPLRVGGHSKGGNLAIYASAFCNARIRRRIKAVYSNDAPGFSRAVIASPGYRAISGRIQSFVPQSSVVGMLFEHEEDYTVVKSVQTGLMQHDVYSWQVTRDDVERLDRVTQGSRFLDRALKEWIGSLSREELRQFSDTLYSILLSTHADSLPKLSSRWLKNAGLMIQSFKDIDEPTRKLIRKALAALFRAATNNIATLLPGKRKTNSIQESAASFSPQAGSESSGDA
jgi:hypothetical protein